MHSEQHLWKTNMPPFQTLKNQRFLSNKSPPIACTRIYNLRAQARIWQEEQLRCIEGLVPRRHSRTILGGWRFLGYIKEKTRSVSKGQYGLQYQMPNVLAEDGRYFLSYPIDRHEIFAECKCRAPPLKLEVKGGSKRRFEEYVGQ